jgi:hypothetical protein
MSTMDVDNEKSEDELELERLVFGDSTDVKDRLRGKADKDTISKTDLEHLEDDQVPPTDSRPQAYKNSYSLSIQGRKRMLKWRNELDKMKKRKAISCAGQQHGTTATMKP